MLTLPKSCLWLSGLILSAAPVPPGVKVQVTCPVDLACPGMAVPFRATVEGAPTGICQWTVTEAGNKPEFEASASMSCAEGEWRVPTLTGFKLFTISATSVHDAKARGEATILA